MKLRKILTLVAIIAMIFAVAGLATGCDDDTPAPTPTPAANDDPATGDDDPVVDDDPVADDDEPVAGDDEPVAGDVVVLQAVFPGAASDGQAAVLEAVNAKLIADGLNINIEITYLDDYWQQLALAIAGGQVFDLAWSHLEHLGDNVRLGVFQPIDDALAAHGPVLLEHTPDSLWLGGSVAGVRYAMPRVVPLSYARSVFNIRGDIREAHGIPPITTIEHMEQFLAAVAEHEEDMYPAGGWLPETLYPVYINAHFLVNWLLFVYPDDPTVHSLWHSEEMAQIMERLWSWAQNGWLLSPDEHERLDGPDAGFDHGFVAAVNANPMRALERVDQFTQNVPDGRIETVVLYPDAWWNFFAGDNQLAVPSTSNNVNEAVQFVNWLKSSQENFDLFSFGVEGVNYQLVDGAVDTSIGTGANHYSINRWMWDDLRLARFSANFSQTDVNQLMTWDDRSQLSPYLGFMFDQEPVSNEMAAIWGIIWGPTGIAEFTRSFSEFAGGRDQLIRELDAAGLQTVVEEAQRQLDEWMAGR